MAIKKKKTNKCKTRDAMRVVSAGITDGQGTVSFIDSGIGSELSLPVTREEYAHIATGAGTTIDAFDSGLSKAFRYQFLLCTEQVDGKETVVAVHSAPLASYMDCDWSEELNRRVPDGAVICTFRDNGGIDLNTFPPQFQGMQGAVLGKLAELDSVSTTTAFNIGNVNCKVKNIDGQECTLVMKRAGK